jgi:hypothetical protein
VVIAMTTNMKLLCALAAGAAVQFATAYELAAVVQRDNAPAPASV